MFGFGQSAEIKLELSNIEGRQFELVDNGIECTRRYVYIDGDNVAGKMYIKLKKPGKKLDHKGISVTFIALVDVHTDTTTCPPFVHEFKCLMQPGYITEDQEFSFEFPKQKKPFQSFYGTVFSIRYIIVGRILKSMSEIKTPLYLSVHAFSRAPRNSENYYTEIGLKKCILMDLELNKLDFHLQDMIIGRVTWKLVNLPIRKLELVIEKHEIIFTDGFDEDYFTHIEDVYTFEILDGNPSKGDTIPFRVFLKDINLTPTIDSVNDKVSVNYFIYISAFDETGRRYFKREQIRLWRNIDTKNDVKADPKRIVLHNTPNQSTLHKTIALQIPA